MRACCEAEVAHAIFLLAENEPIWAWRRVAEVGSPDSEEMRLNTAMGKQPKQVTARYATTIFLV